MQKASTEAHTHNGQHNKYINTRIPGEKKHAHARKHNKHIHVNVHVQLHKHIQKHKPTDTHKCSRRPRHRK